MDYSAKLDRMMGIAQLCRSRLQPGHKERYPGDLLSEVPLEEKQRMYRKARVEYNIVRFLNAHLQRAEEELAKHNRVDAGSTAFPDLHRGEEMFLRETRDAFREMLDYFEV
jgi:hypothetical protein